MKRIALLTDAYEADPTYSINIICEEILSMLIKFGYQPVALVEEIFKPVRVWRDVELRHIPAYIPRGNDIRFHDGWEDDVAKIKATLDNGLDGIDVILTHDIIYQASGIWINMAARQWAKENPSATWLNWVHSATPSPIWNTKDKRVSECQVHFPGSKTIYPNAYSRMRVATNFNCEVDDVAFVPHPTDVCSFLGLHDETIRLVDETRMLEADFILVYPCRLDRGKQVEYVLRTAAALKAIGRSARVVVCDFHSTGGDKVVYRKELQRQGIELGLEEHELTFTSQFSDEWGTRVPRSVVRDLFLLCNVFVMPSRSETYSLVAQEAALCGAFLVLNFDFPPMLDIYGTNAAYFKFSSNIDALSGLDGETNTTYGDTDEYFKGVALRLAYELDNNHVLAQQRRIRQQRNPDYVFKRFIEPLFHFRDG